MSTNSATDGHPNWLDRCDDDDDCQGADECICGVCTLSCSKAETCEGLGVGVSCMPTTAEACSQGANAAACWPTCYRDEDCTAFADADCRGGACLPPLESSPKPEDETCGARPLDCTRHACDDYAPLDSADCDRFSVHEDTCEDVRVRVNVSGTGFVETYWWDAESGALLAYRFTSDQRDYCRRTSADLVYGDAKVPGACPARAVVGRDLCD